MYDPLALGLARKSLTSPVTTFLPELLLRPLRLLDPNRDSSILLPRETTLYFLEPLDLADPAPDASLLASGATNAMMKSTPSPPSFWFWSGRPGVGRAKSEVSYSEGGESVRAASSVCSEIKKQ